MRFPGVIDTYLTLLGVLLAGYAFFGKRFAYLGVGNIYIGEIVLALGVLALYRLGPEVYKALYKLYTFPPVALLTLFMLWGLYRTVPFLVEYGVDALRDSVIWAYGAFAFVVAALLVSNPRRFVSWIKAYSLLSTIFLVVIPIEWVLTRYPGIVLVGGIASFIHLKPGDVLVHLAGVAGYTLSGLLRTSILRYGLVALVFLLFAFENRAGMLAFLTSMLLLFFFRPLSRPPWRLIAIGGVSLAILWVTGLEIDLGRRQLSFNQIVSNVESILTDTNDPKLEGTKSWRLSWWSKIIGYTIYGEYFWVGKGYGVNLADDDGFQVLRDGSLRSPHNGHLNILARSGVPGLLLWLLLQSSWVWYIIKNAVHSKKRGRYVWFSTFVFLAVYWWAFIVNMSFDVFLEGPVGGIWFWTIFGTGIAATIIYRQHPKIYKETI